MAESWRGLSCGSEREKVKLILEREEEQVQNRQILTVRTEIRSGCAVQSLVRGGLVSTLWASCAGVLVFEFRFVSRDRQPSKLRSQVCAQ